MVTFIGYQQGYGSIPHFALFDVIPPGHPSHESTLSIASLIKLNLDIPSHPAYNEWVAKVCSKEINR
jgi:hypothetical protein